MTSSHELLKNLMQNDFNISGNCLILFIDYYPEDVELRCGVLITHI